MSEKQNEPPHNGRQRFIGGQIRAALYAVGCSISATRWIVGGMTDLYLLGLAALFILLAWAETCPVCGKPWWKHRGQWAPNAFKMIFVAVDDCPDNHVPPGMPPDHWRSR